MPTDSDAEQPASSTSKSTGALTAATGPLTAPQPRRAHISPRSLVRLGEQIIFLTAVIGAVALGLGITDYIREHRYVAAYLLAYVGFRLAELVVDDHPGNRDGADHRARRVLDEFPVLILFAAAPFERTFYTGDAPAWLGALGLLLQLGGLWLALGSRVQIHFFSEDSTGREHAVLVTTGFYRYVRHPVYAGRMLVLVAWPLVYGAPIVALITIVISVVVARRQVTADEQVLLKRFGTEYEEYRRRTDALIPSIW
ncbi:MAG TPA: isoprenylcysteine carboxylmethyltransferase family protein [Candidatus Binataceae bacterium]|nr:isoprenylcysteine carboxylmethyltransferase family protein [Candidatus Binataceae bacterium]